MIALFVIAVLWVACGVGSYYIGRDDALHSRDWTENDAVFHMMFAFFGPFALFITGLWWVVGEQVRYKTEHPDPPPVVLRKRYEKDQ